MKLLENPPTDVALNGSFLFNPVVNVDDEEIWQLRNELEIARHSSGFSAFLRHLGTLQTRNISLCSVIDHFRCFSIAVAWLMVELSYLK